MAIARAKQLDGLAELVEFRFQLRSFLSFSEQVAESAGVTAQQYQLLQVVCAAEAAGPSLSGIAQQMLLRHNSAVELVDRAERCGLVRRVLDPSDARRVSVEATGKGREVLVHLMAEHLTYLSATGPKLIESLQTLLEERP